MCMARNEEPILGQVLDHMWAQGADRLIVEDGHSTDRTVQVAKWHGAEVRTETDRAWDQQAQLTGLAGLAEIGDWVVPFDADEFWCGNHGTLAETFATAPCDKVYGHMYLYRDLGWRRPDPKPLVKYAFRYQPGVLVGDGAHVLKGIPGGEAHGITIREWQYRSFEHLQQKVAKMWELLDNSPNLNPLSGTHMKRLAAMSADELAAEWETMLAGDWVYDPIRIAR